MSEVFHPLKYKTIVSFHGIMVFNSQKPQLHRRKLKWQRGELCRTKAYFKGPTQRPGGSMRASRGRGNTKQKKGIENKNGAALAIM